jgi:hypothetical protein
MTLKEWKSRITVGAKLRCTYRHYCPEVAEIIQFTRTQGNAAVYNIVSTTRELPDRPNQNQNYWMHFPKARDLKATPAGFELYFPDGKLMSRYEWEVTA